MLAGVTQMKFIAELELLPRGLSIGPLLEGVARSLFEAVEPLDGACVDTHTQRRKRRRPSRLPRAALAAPRTLPAPR